MDFLETLKQDPGCLYIYNSGPYIYGLTDKPGNYIVIVKDDGKCTRDDFSQDTGGIYFCTIENLHYSFYRMKYWFDKVLLGDIDCGECACLNKKFIIKEHVKLMMSTNPLNLRKEVDSLRHKSDESINGESIYGLGSDIKRCKFANQIIENHKIINFKEANKDYYLLEEANDKNYVYRTLMEVPYSNLKLKTDNILKRSKIQKVLQKKKNG